MWKKSEIIKWMCETHTTNQKIGCRIFTMTQLTKVLLSLKKLLRGLTYMATVWHGA